MRLSKHKSSTHIGMDMMPMIDVTLLLLFFFMTVSQVQNADREPLDLPRLEGTKERLDDSLVINVFEDGAIVVADQRLTAPQLAVWTSEEIRRRGDNPDALKVTIRGDASGAAASVNDVVRSLNRLGVKQVRMAVANTD
jgi:biopolymer transport protein ExbD